MQSRAPREPANYSATSLGFCELPPLRTRCPSLPAFSSSNVNALIRVPVIYALGKRHKEGAIDIGKADRIKTPFRSADNLIVDSEIE